MNIKQALQSSIKQLEQNNNPSAILDAEVLLLEALNRNRKKESLRNENFVIPLKKGIQDLSQKMNFKNITSVVHQKLINRRTKKTKNEILFSISTSLQDDNLKIEKSWLYSHDDYELSKTESILFNNYINRRIKHEPVAYITNKKEFFGFEFFVNENVLIPRPETELLVENVLEIIGNGKNINKQFNLIDVGTGSGCILISILNELQKKNNIKFINQTIAIDISKKAIEVASINAKKYNLDENIKFITGNLKNNLKQKLFTNSFDYIVTANLPYIRNCDYDKLSNNVKDFEPQIALTSGRDGLRDINNLLDSISKIKLQLAQNIYLLIEADPEQIDLLEKEENIHLKIKRIIQDFSGRKRVIVFEKSHS